MIPMFAIATTLFTLIVLWFLIAPHFTETNLDIFAKRWSSTSNSNQERNTQIREDLELERSLGRISEAKYPEGTESVTHESQE